MRNFCHSCSAPTDMQDFKGPSDIYCRYCTDEHGDLKPRAEVQQGIARWLSSWQPDLDEETATARAGIFMQAMPAWAETG